MTDCIMEMIYKIDGVNFKDYGVYVSSSSGLLGSLRVKAPLTVSWEDENGYSVDGDAPLVWEARSIVLRCFMCASSSEDASSRIRDFAGLFYKSGLRTLQVSIGDKSLSYEVLFTEFTDVSSVFKQGEVVATFTLKMEEIEPHL